MILSRKYKYLLLKIIALFVLISSIVAYFCPKYLHYFTEKQIRESILNNNPNLSVEQIQGLINFTSK
jgi:uncharacterized protein YneF (UPF0154 family)